MPSNVLRGLRLAALLLTGASTLAALPFDAQATAAPSAPGQLPVACTNVSQDFSRVAAGQQADAYWEGQPFDGKPHYASDLLIAPAGALGYSLPLPEGGSASFVAIACYPTTPDNARPDYLLPDGN